jgi:hypothetical protein
MSKSGLRPRILQKLSHGHEDFARKLLADTARAMVMAPTSAQYVMIARDLAAQLSFSLVSRIKFANHSKVL